MNITKISAVVLLLSSYLFTIPSHAGDLIINNQTSNPVTFHTEYPYQSPCSNSLGEMGVTPAFSMKTIPEKKMRLICNPTNRPQYKKCGLTFYNTANCSGNVKSTMNNADFYQPDAVVVTIKR